MFLGLRNIGMIETADMEIDGITVIAGENNSGKSTVSKALFSVFNSFYRLDKQIAWERRDAVEGIISSAYQDVNGRFFWRFDVEAIAESLVKNRDKYSNDAELLRSDITAMLIQMDERVEKSIEKAGMSGASEKIIQVLHVSDYEILVAIMQKKMRAEFSDQIVNARNPDKNGEITLRIKGNEVTVTIPSDEDLPIKLSGKFDLNTEAVYMDDPFVIDNVGLTPRHLFQHAGHRSRLMLKLTGEAFGGGRIPIGPIDHIIAAKKLESVYERLNAACSGELVRENYAAAYKESKSGKVFDMKNVSTGLKTFVILKTLLLNGSIKENGIIILDEPESHLHPEWQLIFAELIVLVQKAFNLHILINTHSPYFVNALEVHAYRHGIAARCRYYLAERVGHSSVIADVSDNIEKIYEKLARPLQDLENMRYAND